MVGMPSLAAFSVLLLPGLLPVISALVVLVTLPVMVAPSARRASSADSLSMLSSVPVII